MTPFPFQDLYIWLSIIDKLWQVPVASKLGVSSVPPSERRLMKDKNLNKNEEGEEKKKKTARILKLQKYSIKKSVPNK